MKRLIAVALIMVFSLLTVACNKVKDKQSDVSENEYETVSDIASTTAPYFISDSVYASDGIIEPLNQNDLITKLSRLKAGMLLDEVIEIFGKEPFVVRETGVDMFVYYSGDITITLWGTSLFQAMVDYNDSSVWIDLGINISYE